MYTEVRPLPSDQETDDRQQRFHEVRIDRERAVRAKVRSTDPVPSGLNVVNLLTIHHFPCVTDRGPLASQVAWEGEHKLEKEPPSEVVTVFVPTTPLPTQGFTLVLPRSDVQELPISVPDAIKLVVSGGIIASRPDGKIDLPNEPVKVPSEPALRGEESAAVSGAE